MQTSVYMCLLPGLMDSSVFFSASSGSERQGLRKQISLIMGVVHGSTCDMYQLPMSRPRCTYTASNPANCCSCHKLICASPDRHDCVLGTDVYILPATLYPEVASGLGSVVPPSAGPQCGAPINSPNPDTPSSAPQRGEAPRHVRWSCALVDRRLLIVVRVGLA